jgi:hypothetical protein
LGWIKTVHSSGPNELFTDIFEVSFFLPKLLHDNTAEAFLANTKEKGFIKFFDKFSGHGKKRLTMSCALKCLNFFQRVETSKRQSDSFKFPNGLSSQGDISFHGSERF